MKWLILLMGIFFNAAASVLIKIAVQRPRPVAAWHDALATWANWQLWLGMSCYGAAFLLYAVALTRFPLNVVHPLLTAGAIAAVALLSVLVFREPFPWTRGVGILLIIAGVVMISAPAD